MKPRTGARYAAVQALYQSDQTGETVETVLDQFVRHRIGGKWLEEGTVPAADIPLLGRILRTAATHQDAVDGLIAGHLVEGWPMHRLDPVLRALLRAATAELHIADGAPAKVIISEYLSVAHGFFSGEEPRMANAVLDRIARILRPSEFAAAS